MLNNKQFIALVGAFVLAGGLISCNPDRNLSGSVGLTGMLVHEPVFVRRDSTRVALSQFKKAETLNLYDKMKLAAVLNGGKGLSTLTVESHCQAGTVAIGADRVTLPYSPSYSIVQFFTEKTLLSKAAPDATNLACSMKFTVTAVNGSTHSFSVKNVNIATETAGKTSVQILDNGLVASNDDGFIRMDFNEMGRYRIAVEGVDFAQAEFICEIVHATVDKSLIGNPLYSLRFAPRTGMESTYAAIDKPEQYCRILFYRSDSTVIAASNLILMTMAEEQFTVHRVPSAYPDQMQSKNIFDYSWRDYAVENHGPATLFFAIPATSTSTVDYENSHSEYTSGPNLWMHLKLPTQIVVNTQSHSDKGFLFFSVNPGQSVDVRIGVQPHDFICDQWRIPVEYTVAIDDNEIPIYQIVDPEDPIDPQHVLHSDVIERRFVMTVTDDIFGSNQAYGNHCYRTKPLVGPLYWNGCGPQMAPEPMTPQNRDDAMCVKVD